MYRLLRQDGQLTHRRLERAAQKRSRPRALAATGPDQVFCWDITYLPTQVRGQHFYLYLFEDLFSRKIVGWQVFDHESAALAGQLLIDICLRHGIEPGQLTVHSDNGAPMKGETQAGHDAASGRGPHPQPTGGEQRQPILGVFVQNLEVPPPAAAHAV